MNKDFYGVSQLKEIPGVQIVEHKGVIWGSHRANAQYGYDLTEDFQDKAAKLGANAVINVKTQASRDAFVFTGTAVVVEPE